MSFVATGLPTDASADDEIQAAGFYPAITLSEFRQAARVDHTVDDPRAAFELTSAVRQINRQLEDWRAEQELAGIAAIDETQAGYYSAAVYHHARARLLEQYRDYDSTHTGDVRADTLDPRIDDEWREVRVNLRALKGRARCTVELI